MTILFAIFLAWNLSLLAVGMVESRVSVNERHKVPLDESEGPCINVFCHAGQECIVLGGNATCMCKTTCPNHKNPVCGSNGITYPNHCELHRTACLEGKKISIKNNGTCRGQPTALPPSSKISQSKPVVCYEHDRDELRSRLIEWLRNQDESLEGYRKLLRAHFNLADESNDGKLDGTEFTDFIKTNESISKVSSSDEYVNPILQGLCADALISVSDDDSDWGLNFEEFSKCLDPDFEPPKKGCELDDQVYSDGTEIPTDCNSCVCACSVWVCTALKCHEDSGANETGAEITEEETMEPKFIVNGEEAKEQVTREIIMQKEKEKDRNILPLFKPNHGKEQKHGHESS